jgi:integrative and conjugative element protein (TIGR02256 family)
MPSCFIPHAVLTKMYSEAAKRAPLETGGVLLGLTTPTDVWIEELIGPGPTARHNETRFVPDHEYQEQAIADSYAVSGRRLAYLGDWHSHPDGPLSLSSRDLQTLRNIARHKRARQPRPIMAIVAGGPSWAARVWRVGGGRWRPFKCRVEEVLLVVID